jgi:hypothetical protein
MMAFRRSVLHFGQGIGASVKPTTSTSPRIRQRTKAPTRTLGVR